MSSEMRRRFRSYPVGMPDNSPTHQRWAGVQMSMSPEGTAELRHCPLSCPIRDSVNLDPFPNVEALGYYPVSLRDRLPCCAVPRIKRRTAGALHKLRQLAASPASQGVLDYGGPAPLSIDGRLRVRNQRSQHLP